MFSHEVERASQHRFSNTDPSLSSRLPVNLHSVKDAAEFGCLIELPESTERALNALLGQCPAGKRAEFFVHFFIAHRVIEVAARRIDRGYLALTALGDHFDAACKIAW